MSCSNAAVAAAAAANNRESARLLDTPTMRCSRAPGPVTVSICSPLPVICGSLKGEKRKISEKRLKKLRNCFAGDTSGEDLAYRPVSKQSWFCVDYPVLAGFSKATRKVFCARRASAPEFVIIPLGFPMYDNLVEPLRRADIYRSIAETHNALCTADLRTVSALGVDHQATLSAVGEKSHFTRTCYGQFADHRRWLAIDGILRSQCWRAGSRLGCNRFGAGARKDRAAIRAMQTNGCASASVLPPCMSVMDSMSICNNGGQSNRVHYDELSRWRLQYANSFCVAACCFSFAAGAR